mmetsp:Transcript_51918/g.161078  ORF Transcript_51918/g.161078 Transcript_51918/m.161078 type:complete len:219 (-) Transcript_51918:37-693(-)
MHSRPGRSLGPLARHEGSAFESTPNSGALAQEVGRAETLAAGKRLLFRAGVALLLPGPAARQAVRPAVLPARPPAGPRKHPATVRRAPPLDIRQLSAAAGRRGARFASAEEVRGGAVAPVAAQGPGGYARVADLLPSTPTVEAVVRAILRARLAAHLVRQHRTSIHGAHAVHVLQHHAATRHWHRGVWVEGALLRWLVCQRHDLLLAAPVVVDREGST